jgi:hypothetical protein
MNFTYSGLVVVVFHSIKIISESYQGYILQQENLVLSLCLLKYTESVLSSETIKIYFCYYFVTRKKKSLIPLWFESFWSTLL